MSRATQATLEKRDAGDPEVALINRLIAAFHGSETREKLFHPHSGHLRVLPCFVASFASRSRRECSMHTNEKRLVYVRALLRNAGNILARSTYHTLIPSSRSSARARPKEKLVSRKKKARKGGVAIVYSSSAKITKSPVTCQNEKKKKQKVNVCRSFLNCHILLGGGAGEGKSC